MRLPGNDIARGHRVCGLQNRVSGVAQNSRGRPQHRRLVLNHHNDLRPAHPRGRRELLLHGINSLLFCARQENRKCGAGPRLALYRDVAVRLPDYAVAGRKTEAGALADILCGVERIKDAADILGRDAAAIVAHANRDVFANAQLAGCRRTDGILNGDRKLAA